MLLEQRRLEIEVRFQRRMEELGEYGAQIAASAGKMDAETGTALKYLYVTMPLSDLANYSFETFTDYAKHGVYLWKYGTFSRRIPEDIFLNYVLYHRINEEEISECRSFFYSKIKNEIRPDSMRETILNLNYWCAREAAYRSTDDRTVSPMTVYRSAYGRCGEESAFTVSVLRSAGIPARQVYAPRWSHCDDNHAWAEVWCDGKWHFLGACEPEEILDRGWFTNASSRAMMVHSRWFDYEKCPEELCGKEGCAVLCSQLKRYADTKTLEVKAVDEKHNPAAGAVIDFEVLNYGELSPIASLKTDADGIVRLTTGKGSLHLHAHMGNIFAEQVIAPDVTEAELVLCEQKTGALLEADWSAGQAEDFDMIAPVDTPVNTDCPTKEQREHGAVRLKEAVQARQNKENTFIKDGGIREESCGNYREIERVMASGESFAEKIWDVLSKKDCRDCKSGILLEHIREAAVFADNYAPDIFAKYVLSPRIYTEPLTAYRTVLKSCFTEQERAAFCRNPQSIWEYIEQNIREQDEEEYPHLITSPAGAMRIKRASALSKKILFAALCRTFGIAARINTKDMTAEYRLPDRFLEQNVCVKEKTTAALPSAGVWISVDENAGKLCTLRLSFATSGVVWKYGENWTLARLSDGVFRTLGLQDMDADQDFNSGECIRLSLAEGTYRLITSNRLPNGNIFCRKQMIALDGKAEKEAALILRGAQLSDMLEEIAVGDFELHTENGGIVCAKELLENSDSVVAFLEEGKEPTEHILNELYDKADEMNVLDVQFVFVVRGREALLHPTVQRTVRRLKNVQVYFDDFTQLVETLARRMYADPEKLPLVIAFRGGMTGVYAVSGYNVGTADMLLKIMESGRKREK